MADKNKKWVTFDPTVHAGHVMTAGTIIACALTSWLAMRNDINTLYSENAQRKAELIRVEAEVQGNRQEMARNFEKLRDDMQGWFMALNDKLEKKADRR